MLHYRCAIVTVTIVLCTAVGYARHVVTDDSVQQRQAEYLLLLERSKNADPTVDYVRMREIYAARPEYNPYGSCIDNVEVAIGAKKYDEARQLIEACLQREWVHLHVHALAYMIYRKQGDTTRADLHATIFRDIFAAMQQGGDGASAATAIDVLFASEEYAYLDYIGAAFPSQALMRVDGSSYDVMTTKDAKGAPLKVWFRIDKMFAVLTRGLGSD